MVPIERSYPAPECLEKEKKKKNGDYKCGDVLQRLQQDFRNKCYLCEYKAPPGINVEHFIPHKDDKEKKFDWDNLFYACGHCNNTKLAKYNTDDTNQILNCTDPAHDVVNWIKYEVENFPKLKVKITALQDGKLVENTATLLHEIYNGTTIMKQMEAGNIRERLKEELLQFQEIILRYVNTRNLNEKAIYFNQIQKHLQPSSAFTAFKIWIICGSPVLSRILL